jgi:hypothetical protein
MGKICNLLARLFPYRIVRTNIQTNRDIRIEGDKKTIVSEKVIPVVAYDVNTGEFKNFGTWEQEQTYKSGIVMDGSDFKLGTGNKFYFDDNLSSYLTADINGRAFLYMGGGLHCKFDGVTRTEYTRAMRLSKALELVELSSDPSVPAATVTQLWSKSDNKLYFRDGDGTKHEVAFV